MEPKPRKRRHLQKSESLDCGKQQIASDSLTDSDEVMDTDALHVSTQTHVTTEEKSSQATPPSMLSAKIENVILKNKMQTKNEKSEVSFSFETCSKDDKKFSFYTGLHILHFMTIWNFLGDITNKLSYWGKARKNETVTPTKRTGPKRKLSPINQLFLTLMKLRRGYCNKDLAYRFNVSDSYVSTIVITWIQLLFHEFQTLKYAMFPTRQKMKKNIAPCFRPYKNIRVIVDCTEIFVQTPQNFSKQANLCSNYKHHHTYKVLVGLSPTGAICYLSDAFEGAKSDKEVFLDSDIMSMLNPGDQVMADRGFTIEQELAAKGVSLNIPPFLHGRKRLTPQEEVDTKRIARCRIHVERVIERLKKYRVINGVVPLHLGPLVSQIVFVVGCLVNFQKPIC